MTSNQNSDCLHKGDPQTGLPELDGSKINSGRFQPLDTIAECSSAALCGGANESINSREIFGSPASNWHAPFNSKRLSFAVLQGQGADGSSSSLPTAVTVAPRRRNTITTVVVDSSAQQASRYTPPQSFRYPNGAPQALIVPRTVPTAGLTMGCRTSLFLQSPNIADTTSSPLPVTSLVPIVGLTVDESMCSSKLIPPLYANVSPRHHNTHTTQMYAMSPDLNESSTPPRRGATAVTTAASPVPHLSLLPPSQASAHVSPLRSSTSVNVDRSKSTASSSSNFVDPPPLRSFSPPDTVQDTDVNSVGSASTTYFGGASMQVFPSPMRLNNVHLTGTAATTTKMGHSLGVSAADFGLELHDVSLNAAEVSNTNGRWRLPDPLHTGSAPVTSFAIPFVSCNNGITAAHRTFSEAALNEVGTFLAGVMNEVGLLALRRTMQEGGFFVGGGGGANFSTGSFSPHDRSVATAAATSSVTGRFGALASSGPFNLSHKSNDLHPGDLPASSWQQQVNTRHSSLSSGSVSRRMNAAFGSTCSHTLPLGYPTSHNVQSADVLAVGGGYEEAGRLLPSSRRPSVGFAPAPTRAATQRGLSGNSTDSEDSEDSEGEVMRSIAREHFLFHEHNNFFEYPKCWFDSATLQLHNREESMQEALIATTSEPPLFHAGMLLDPITGQFLFDGVAFTEEARVMRTTITRSEHDNAVTSSSTPGSASLPTGTVTSTSTTPTVAGASINQEDSPIGKAPHAFFTPSRPGSMPKAPPSRRLGATSSAAQQRHRKQRDSAPEVQHYKILVREYYSVSKVDEGWAIQTFSFLPMDVDVEASRQHVLEPAVVQRLMPLTLPGALTRSFPLQCLVRRSNIHPPESDAKEAEHAETAVASGDDDATGSDAAESSIDNSEAGEDRLPISAMLSQHSSSFVRGVNSFQLSITQDPLLVDQHQQQAMYRRNSNFGRSTDSRRRTTPRAPSSKAARKGDRSRSFPSMSRGSVFCSPAYLRASFARERRRSNVGDSSAPSSSTSSVGDKGMSNSKTHRSLPTVVSSERRVSSVAGVGHYESSSGGGGMSRARRQVHREPVANELDLRRCNPRLFHWAMSYEVSQLLEPTDTARACLEHFHIVVLFRLHMQIVLAAARMMQRFLRKCLAKKRRAMQRMIAIWRRLELESRAKLQYYKPPASSLERIDMIAGNILQQHMLTPREYKVSLIEELWAERMRQHCKWRKDQRLDAQLLQFHGATAAVGALPTVTGDGCSVSIGSMNTTSCNLPQHLPVDLSELIPAASPNVAPDLVSVENVTRRVTQAFLSHSTPPSAPTSSFAAATTLFNGRVSSSVFGVVQKKLAGGGGGTATRRHTGNTAAARATSIVTVAAARQQRLDDEAHTHFGWYIDPEELLYESHHRLLASLKSSAMTMEQVQFEVQRAVQEGKTPEQALRKATTSRGAGAVMRPGKWDTFYAMNGFGGNVSSAGDVLGGNVSINGRSSGWGGSLQSGFSVDQRLL